MKVVTWVLSDESVVDLCYPCCLGLAERDAQQEFIPGKKCVPIGCIHEGECTGGDHHE